jgi:methyl-accepting chemotaxis protein
VNLASGLLMGLAVLAGVGIGLTMTRSLTRALGAEPAELAEVAGRIAQGSLADDGRARRPRPAA